MEGDWEGRCNLDVETLDCPICMDLLAPPIYQCENGHIICSACCENLTSKTCPTCTQPTGRMRCLAMEQIVESVRVPCKHGLYGCKQMLPFCKPADRQDHENRACKFQPIPCPLLACSHEAPMARFSSHLTEDHGVARSEWDVVRGRPRVKLRMSSDDGCRMLELAGGILLVHREDEKGVGDAFFCTAYGASVTTCELKVTRRRDSSASYEMKTPVLDWSMRSVRESCSFVDRLVVPTNHLPGEFDVTVRLGYPDDAPDRRALADSLSMFGRDDADRPESSTAAATAALQPGRGRSGQGSFTKDLLPRHPQSPPAASHYYCSQSSPAAICRRTRPSLADLTDGGGLFGF